MQIGAYQVLFELGRGGMGRVYLGRTVGEGGFERLVAIKRAHPVEAPSQEISDRFLNEARLAGFVHHANVVAVHQAGRDEEGHYLICEYVEGESLAGLTDRARSHARTQARIPPGIVARIVLDGLAGLHAVHEAVDAEGRPLGMLHRDVSMDNLLVGRDGVTRLADFGIAKSTASKIVTGEGVRHGKLIYFSPEYLYAGASVGRTFDIYGMGMTLWAGLAGTLPWQGLQEQELVRSIVMEGLPPLASVGVAADPVFDSIIARACHRDARSRFQRAREMLDALESLGKRPGAVASQVEVAEYVEATIGAELAERRERIQMRRRELDEGPTLPTISPLFGRTEPTPAPAALGTWHESPTPARALQNGTLPQFGVPASGQSGASTPSRAAAFPAGTAVAPSSTIAAELTALRGRLRSPQLLGYAGALLVAAALGYALVRARPAAHPEHAPAANVDGSSTGAASAREGTSPEPASVRASSPPPSSAREGSSAAPAESVRANATPTGAPRVGSPPELAPHAPHGATPLPEPAREPSTQTRDPRAPVEEPLIAGRSAARANVARAAPDASDGESTRNAAADTRGQEPLAPRRVHGKRRRGRGEHEASVEAEQDAPQPPQISTDNPYR